MNKLERKFGKYAIKNLPLILIICYGIGYLLSIIDPNGVLTNFITLDPYKILHGEVWRLVSWVLIPPSGFSFFTILMLLFYYSIGRTLEQVWGSFKFNVYIFSGMIFTVIGSFMVYACFSFIPYFNGMVGGLAGPAMSIIAPLFSTYYINMSIFLAFASTFPDNRVLLMFIIPLKIKWLGIAYAVMLVYDVLTASFPLKIVIIMSLLNFIVFFFSYRKSTNQSIKARFEQAQRRRDYETKMQQAANAGSVSKHRCAICGRTELDNPDLQFRFCSKCNGNYEYCNDHLFTHKHVE